MGGICYYIKKIAIFKIYFCRFYVRSMDDNQELTGHLYQGQGEVRENEQDQINQQYITDEHQIDFQKYLEPNSQLGQNFGYMDPNELPGQHYMTGDDGFNLQDQGMQRDVFGQEELIQIENKQDDHVGSNAAYHRSRPDGSPMFSQSSGFVPGDSESVVFRPIKQLDFSSLDDTAMTDVILPRGVDRSVSTPDHKNSKSISMISREQFIENSGMDRNESPDGNFYELKSSPNHSEQEEELDSKVIFSPLHGFNNQFQGEHFDPGMKSPPLSKIPNIRQNIPQNFNFGNQQNYVTDGNVELSQRPINERDISPFQNDSLEQNQNSPQHSVQPFGRDSRSPKYSSSHGQSPHHHSISPSRCHLQTIETREIFVSVPQHTQFGHSPDSLNQSGGEHQKLIDLEMNEGQSQIQRNVNMWAQQQYISTSAPSSQQTQNRHQNYSHMSDSEKQKHVQNVTAKPPTVMTKQQTETNEDRSQSFPNQTGVQINQNRDSNKPPNNTKPEVKSNDKKPWNYAKGSGNRDPSSYLEKGAQKREILAQNAKSRMVREEPKGKVQERNISSQPVKTKRDMRMGNVQSTENINRVGEGLPTNRNTRQSVQGQSRVGNAPGFRGQSAEDQNKFSGVPVSMGNRGDYTKQTGVNRDSREPPKTREDYSPVTQVEQYSDAHVSR